MRITIIIEDQEDGSVSIVAAPNVATMIDRYKQGQGIARTQGVAYALGMLTYAARKSREMAAGQTKKSPLIHLPPGVRLD